MCSPIESTGEDVALDVERRVFVPDVEEPTALDARDVVFVRPPTTPTHKDKKTRHQHSHPVLAQDAKTVLDGPDVESDTHRVSFLPPVSSF